MEHTMLAEKEKRNVFLYRSSSDGILLKEEQIYQGNLVLVNQKHPVRYRLSREELCSVFPKQPEILMEKKSAKMLQLLLKEITGDTEQAWESFRRRAQTAVERESQIHQKPGEIAGVSGYRTKKEQKEIFENSLMENGREFTETYVAFPDHSEHQTGLAMDLAENRPEIDFIRPEFPRYGICQRFRERASAYGFVERYKTEKQKITGIGSEPWHFRYVGTPHAEIMEKTGLALEEYIQWLKQFDLTVHPLTWKQYRIGYVRARGAVTEWKGLTALQKTGEHSLSGIGAEAELQTVISGNNADGFIITIAAL